MQRKLETGPRPLESSLECGAWSPEERAGMPALWAVFLNEQVLYLLKFEFPSLFKNFLLNSLGISKL